MGCGEPGFDGVRSACKEHQPDLNYCDQPVSTGDLPPGGRANPIIWAKIA
jgi:hypothetical protein